MQARVGAIRLWEMVTSKKIQLYTLQGTLNAGTKVIVALEEMGLDYELHTVNVATNEQSKPEFLAINLNGKIPAIVDPEGPDGKLMNIFESGAILQYLAEKTGKFLSQHPQVKLETIQWLFLQMANVAPMLGQIAKDKCMDLYPLEHYTNEARHVHLLDQCLEGHDYLNHEGYKIADMAILPRVYALEEVFKASEYLGLHNFPNVMAWKTRCMELPATAKGLTTGKRL